MSDHSAWQQQAKTALQQLTPPGKPVSKAERFRTLLPDIEQSIANKVPQADIVAALADAGLPLNIETFRNYLSDARRRLKASHEKRQTTQRPTPTPPAAQRLASAPTAGDHRSTRDRTPNW